MVSLKVTIAHVRGMADKLKRKQIFVYFKMQKADVLFFPETVKMEKFWRSEYGKAE